MKPDADVPTVPTPQPPRAQRRPVVRTHHDDEFLDPYEWLRDKDDADVIAHLSQENAYTESRTTHLAGLRDQLFSEIKGRVLESDLSVPTRLHNWWYYGRTLEGQQYGLQCRAPIGDVDDWTPPELAPDVEIDGEQILFDGNVEAEGHGFFSLGSFDVSNDGERILFGVDTAGDERYTVYVRDVATGQLLPDEIPDTFAGAQFSPDGKHILYTTVDDSWRPDTLWLHELGTPVDTDTSLFHESDERFWVGAAFTRSEKYLVIELGSSITSEAWLVDASDLRGAPRVVWPRHDGVEYGVNHAVVDDRDVLFVLHNDGAQDFELIRVEATDPTGQRTVVLPHRPGTRLLGMSTFRDWGVVEYRRDGITQVALLDYRSHATRELVFGEALYTVGVTDNAEWAPPLLRLGYSSFVTPGTVYDYDVAADELIMRKQQPVLGGYDPADYGQQRVWATAEDGTAIPISVVWKRACGEPGESPAPLHLYGYGSYENSIDPGFSVARLSELDRGVTFAVAHVRGGGELGRHWYEDGKIFTKVHSFSDFVDCARHLIAAGYTTPDRLVAEGASAGGLLVGAAMNRAPELFAGVLAGVPFVDALTTILDPSLPLTVIEWDEWGDPLHDPRVYAYMKSYSPYENVRDDATYPKVLAVTSLNDTRVLFVEPAKWVARLRDVGADVLLKCELEAGHGGVSGRYESWKERAFEIAWILDVLRVSP